MIKKTALSVIVLIIFGCVFVCAESVQDHEILLKKAAERCMQKLSHASDKAAVLQTHALFLHQLGCTHDDITLSIKKIIQEASCNQEEPVWQDDDEPESNATMLWVVGIGTCVLIGVVGSYFLWNYFQSSKAQNSSQTQTQAQTYTYHTAQGNQVTISLVQGDITQQQFARQDQAAIVNAANEQLAAGGGVCGAIFGAAGHIALTAECNNHPVLDNAGTRCPTGDARITQGCNLAPLRIIHAVGPRGQNAPVLTNAYQNSLRVGSQNNITGIAFPSISTGIFGYDIRQATPVAIQAVLDFINQNPGSGIQEVRFVTFDAQSTALYRNLLNNTAQLDSMS